MFQLVYFSLVYPSLSCPFIYLFLSEFLSLCFFLLHVNLSHSCSHLSVSFSIWFIHFSLISLSLCPSICLFLISLSPSTRPSLFSPSIPFLFFLSRPLSLFLYSHSSISLFLFSCSSITFFVLLLLFSIGFTIYICPSLSFFHSLSLSLFLSCLSFVSLPLIHPFFSLVFIHLSPSHSSAFFCLSLSLSFSIRPSSSLSSPSISFSSAHLFLMHPSLSFSCFVTQSLSLLLFLSLSFFLFLSLIYPALSFSVYLL